MSKKYEIAACLTVAAAEFLYQEYGIATPVSDGKFVEIVKEGK